MVGVKVHPPRIHLLRLLATCVCNRRRPSAEDRRVSTKDIVVARRLRRSHLEAARFFVIVLVLHCCGSCCWGLFVTYIN